MPRLPLRMIDANLNRSSEGLRVLEDIARFVLDNADLSHQLRSMRHDLAQQTKSLRVGLLSQRNSQQDVGRPHSNEKEANVPTTSHRGLLDVVTANAKRVEESLRVMEELARLPEIDSIMNSTSFEQTRFTLYTLERDLISRILRRDKLQRMTGLYVILDWQFLEGRDALEVAGQIIQGGAKVIQLRDKQGKKRELLPVAQRLKELCSQGGVLFIMNDYLDLALASDADGLHIGQEDLPLPVVRGELPIDKIIGCSTTTVARARKAQDEGADYVAVGSMFATSAKKEVTVVGVDRLRELKRAISAPLVAIGGINQGNIEEVVRAGADAVAVISAALGQEDVKGTVQKLVTKMDLVREKCQNQ